MVILGIHDGHDASAALMVDGKIIAANQEERFSKLKGDYGYPFKAVQNCLELAKLKSEDIDLVSLASKTLNPVLLKIKRNANFSVSDWIKEQNLYWKPTLLQKKKVNYWKLFGNNKKFKTDKYYNYKDMLGTYMDKKNMYVFQERRIDAISNFLNIDKSKIHVQFHEDCHKYYSYFFFKDRSDGVLLTSESIGDFSSGSVSVVNNGNFKLVAHTKENHLGHIYQYMTLLLGMKPSQHEYKVMGMAPYANKFEINKCLKVFMDVLKVKKLNIVYKKKPKDLFFYFKEKFIACRFDGIAGAVQIFLEKMLLKWFDSCSKILKKKTFYFSGGVAQNIKAGMFVSENSKKIRKLFIPPAAGDTSLSIGACYLLASKICRKKNLDQNKFIKPIETMYLGFKNKNSAPSFIKKNKYHLKYKYKQNYKSEEIAKFLSKGLVIGRCYGRMEFGLRSLGNRSILCDPRNFENISIINKKIKKRDFWMPFTPTILSEDKNKFIKNPKKLDDRFMSMAFETKTYAHKNLQAAIHPYDKTARPQVLKKNHNREYYDIIKSFKKITGVGALLNTSLNLHGLPIAMSYEDAMNVFEKSDLDIIILDNCFLKKK
jgi:carbamoyltransferase